MVWGFIIGLAVTGGICVLVASATGKQMSIISWIVALAMFVGLSFECNKLINAIEGRSEVSDFVSSIVGSISGYLDYSNGSSIISYEEANQVALGCKLVLPGWGKYFNASDFQGCSYNEIPIVIADRINTAMSRQVWNMLGWIVLTSIMGAVLIIVFFENSRSHRKTEKGRHQSVRRNQKYRSRRRN